MRVPCFWLGWLAVGCLLATGAAGAPKWLRLETEDFVIISDAYERDIADFAAGYSGYRYAFRTLFLADGRRQPRSVILLFRRASDFEDRVPEQKDARSRTVCHGGEVDGGAFLSLAVEGDREAALQIAYEFETIWGLRRVGYSIPLWMSQGAGEVLSTLDMRKGRCILGRPREGFESQIGFDSLSWKKFFGVNAGSSEYSGQSARGRFHAQAWALMHWVLFLDEETRPRFQALALALRGHTAPEAIELTQGVKLDDLSRAVNRHLRRFEPRQLPFDEAAVRAAYRITPATEAEARTWLANLAADADRPADADRELQIAQKLAPEAPYVQEALARRELREGRVDSAAEYYRRAIAAGSVNPRAYVISAMAHLNESSSAGVDYSGAGGRNVEVALAEIRHALELDPGSFEAYKQLGRAFYLAPVAAPEGPDELARGITDDPRTLVIREYRAGLLQRLKRTDEYLGELQAIVTHPDVPPHLVKRLEGRWLKGVFERDVAKVNDLVAKRDFPAAKAFVEAARQEPAALRLDAEYAELSTYVLEQEAWVALRKLNQEERWTEVAEAAQRYLDTFPRTKRLAAVQKMRDDSKARAAAR